MMDSRDKKAAVAAYKERKSASGIYALRCAEAGKVWVGHAPDLDAIMNRTQFTLRMGNHRATGLQQAWNAYGGDSIVFEELERFEEDAIPQGEALKVRLVSYRDRLDALAL